MDTFDTSPRRCRFRFSLARPALAALALTAALHVCSVGRAQSDTEPAAAKSKAGSGAKGKAGSKGAAKTKAAPADASDVIEDKDVAATTPPANVSPLTELKKSNDQLDKLFRWQFRSNFQKLHFLISSALRPGGGSPINSCCQVRFA